MPTPPQRLPAPRVIEEWDFTTNTQHSLPMDASVRKLPAEMLHLGGQFFTLHNIFDQCACGMHLFAMLGEIVQQSAALSAHCQALAVARDAMLVHAQATRALRRSVTFRWLNFCRDQRHRDR